MRQSSVTSASRGRLSGAKPISNCCVQLATSMPERAAGQREHDALGEQLLHQAAAAGAERGSHRELAAPRRAAGDQQAGDVRARDQQHKSDRAEQHEHRRAHIGDHARRQRLALERAAGVALVIARNPIADRFQLLLRFDRAGDRGRRAPIDAEVVDVAAVVARRRRTATSARRAATASTRRSSADAAEIPGRRR